MSGFGSLKVSELKAKLRELGLPVSGNKPELVARLEEAAKPEAEAAETKKCAGCGESFTPRDPRHNRCPECHKEWLRDNNKGRKQGGGRGKGGSRRTWVPRQDKVKETLKQIVGILGGIEARNSFSEGNPRYDFSVVGTAFLQEDDVAAAAEKAAGEGNILAAAVKLYLAGKFGEVELGGTSYKNILDAMYQGVLGEANIVVANGKLADVERIIGEGVTRTDALQALIEDVIVLIDSGKAKDAADKAHTALRAVLRLRNEARDAADAEERKAWVTTLKRDSVPQKEQGRRGKGGKGGKGDDGPRDRRSKPYSRKKKKHHRGPTLREILGGEEDYS